MTARRIGFTSRAMIRVRPPLAVPFIVSEVLSWRIRDTLFLKCEQVEYADIIGSKAERRLSIYSIIDLGHLATQFVAS